MSDISLGGLVAFAFQWPIAVGSKVGDRIPCLAESVILSGYVARCEGDMQAWMIGIVFEDRQAVFRMRMIQ